MKIVLYNYVQPFETNTPGGGVSVYLRNLVAGLRSLGHEIYTMSSGDRYSFVRRTPFVRFNQTEGEILVYNSPNVAPAYYSFYHPDIYSHDRRLDTIPELLKGHIGHVDIFHFHNIEGLTKSFFPSLRKTFPDAGFIYSAHNYSTVCPQVNLWKSNSIACVDNENGRACAKCTYSKDLRGRKIVVNILKTPIKSMRNHQSKIKKTAYFAERWLTKLKRRTFDNTSREVEPRNTDSLWTHKATAFSDFRADNIFIMNSIFDRTIAVSRRTKEVLVSLGVEKEIIDVVYIGTKHYENLKTSNKKTPSPGNLHLGYLGYMKKEKGFFFFLDILENLPQKILASIDITVAARFTDSEALSRMKKLEPRVKSFNAYDGFTHQNLKKILRPINLGIVPPLWEDNLPQVAIEFVTNGIPILTSNKGGAMEIADSPEFVFNTDSVDDAVQKIITIALGTFSMKPFWERKLRLKSISEHTTDIANIYNTIYSKHLTHQN